MTACGRPALRIALGHGADHLIIPLLEAGLLEMTVPDKPRSLKQRYRTTEAGLAALSAPRLP